jgi:hypothetical protein
VTIYLATAEGDKQNGGVYHGDPARRALRDGERIISLVADRSLVPRERWGDVATLDEVTPRAGDVLVVSSAHEFPTRCAEELRSKFPALPTAASSLSYLVAKEQPGARTLDLGNTAVEVTVPSAAEWPSFATNVGLPLDHPHTVVGSPRGDDLPRWTGAKPNQVVVVSGVTGVTPDNDLALEAARELRTAGRDVVIALHPRENPGTYQAEGFAIKDPTTPTIDLVAESGAAVTIPGTVNAEIAALSRVEDGATVGPKVVGLGDHPYLAPHLQDLYVHVARGESTVAALATAQPPSVDTAEIAVGPVGGATDRLVGTWRAAAQTAARSADGQDLDRLRSFIPAGGTVPRPESAPIADTRTTGTATAQRGKDFGRS